MTKNLPLVLVTLLAITAMCSAQTASASKVNINGLEQKLLAKERESWEAYKSKNYEAIKTLFADEYVVYSLDGPSTIQQDVTNLKNNKISVESYTIDDPKIIMATKDVAIIRYKSDLKTTYEGTPSNKTVYITSIWVNRGGRWQNISYSETPVRQN